MLSDDELQVRFGQAMRTARTDQGLTQLEIANRVGLSRPQIANLESGRHLPSGFTMLRLARLLDIDVRAL